MAQLSRESSDFSHSFLNAVSSGVVGGVECVESCHHRIVLSKIKEHLFFKYFIISTKYNFNYKPVEFVDLSFCLRPLQNRLNHLTGLLGIHLCLKVHR